MGIRKYTTKTGKTRYAVNVFNKNTGKTQWVGTYKTSADAKLALADADRRIRLGELLVQRKDIGFSNLVDEWLEVQTVNLRQSTKEDYKYTSRYPRAYFKNRPVSTIEHADVYKFVAWASRQGLSVHYVRKMYVRLSQIFKFAEAMGYTTMKPTSERVHNLPEEPEAKVKPLTADEVRLLIDATPAEHKALMLVFVTCGLRASEALGMTADSVDLENGLLHVSQQLVNGELAPLKTRKARRTIPLATETREALQAHMETAVPNDLGLIFVSERGGPIDYANFRKRVWVPIVERSGLRSDLKLHDLRRTFASMMARHGRSAAYLQDVMGHQQSTTTAKYYIGVYDEERSAAVRDLEDWLSKEDDQGYDTEPYLTA